MQLVVVGTLAIASAAPGLAGSYIRVQDRAEFVSAGERRTPSRLGVGLRVGGDDSIAGRAFGQTETGYWSWQSGHFCQMLNWGSTS